MKTRTPGRLLEVLLFLVVSTSLIWAGQPATKASSTPTKQNQGLLDYALRGINQQDRNYGECVDESRRLLIEQTVDRAYFWSNLVAVIIAFCLFVVTVHQHRLLRRRERVASEWLTQYRNSLARAEDQVEEATQRNHALMRALSSSITLTKPTAVADPDPSGEQTKPRPAPPQRSGNRNPTTATAPSVFATTAPAVAATAPAVAAQAAPVTIAAPAVVTASVTKPSADDATARAAKSARVGDDRRTADQMGLFNADVDLMAKVNTLQQQLNCSQEREKQLRRQLNDSEVRLQREQQKTRSLQA